jgi:hypothetical protein
MLYFKLELEYNVLIGSIEPSKLPQLALQYLLQSRSKLALRLSLEDEFYS